MATVYRIHPAIGIARVGNSPDEFFIGPERLGERPQPVGGFKDAQCRVKRQAARFRIFAHHDDGSFEEITDAEADITWTVRLANRKAAYPGRGNAGGQLVIDPGSRTTNGPNQRQLFDTGSIQFASQPNPVVVPLGEIRSDTDNRLLVLGGFGKSASPLGTSLGHFWQNEDWYDDIADGPVSATIRLRASNTTPAVTGAWVIVAPPKFAPHQDSVTTLWDRLREVMSATFPAQEPVPNATSYTQDVYPILQRARDIRSVYPTSAHNWSDPVPQAMRQAIFDRLALPNTALAYPQNMPLLLQNTQDSTLTPIQYAHLQRWKDGNDHNDWAGVPQPEAQVNPAGMDRAALEACVGAAFYPGIEAGGRDAANRPILAAANYVEAWRVNPALSAGTMSASMALPWQADFYACDQNWWPVPRPYQVMPQGTSTYQEWDRGLGNVYEEMVSKWSNLGFVVQQGNQRVEVERCDTVSISLLTPYLHFVDVPAGPMGMVREVPLAITFEVISPSAAVTLEYVPGQEPAGQFVANNASVTVGPTNGMSVATARLWVIYRTGAAPSSAAQTVQIRHQGGSDVWSVSIDANTVARETAAIALVLDRSGSMSEDRGDGLSKHLALQQATKTFVGVMLEGDGVGLVRYDQDAQVVQQVKLLGNGQLSDLNRNATIDLIDGPSFNPAGATSIGDGIFEGRQILNAASGFTNRALVVLTDGNENRARWISDVAPEIDERTFAIGLGTPQNTSAAALQSISGNHGGFLLITGAITGDNRFALQKYFLQVLAGVTNAEIVLDPDGELVPGAVHRIPFRLTEADAGFDAIVLSPYARAVDFRLQTPTGLILEPWRALSDPGMQWRLGDAESYYRIALPTQLVQGRFDQGGTWHALLTIGTPRTKPNPDDPEQGVDRSILRGLHASPAQRARMAAARATHSEVERRVAIVRDDANQRAFHALAVAAGSHGGGGARRTLPYSLIVHGYSNLAFRAELRQSGWEPGARVDLSATLAQSGIPMGIGATVWAEWTRPDGSRGQIAMSGSSDEGRFHGSFVAAQAGVHRLRVRAAGQSRDGLPFQRERTLTAAVWHGGNRDADLGGDRLLDELRERDARLCRLLDCLLGRDGVIDAGLEKRLREAGVDLDHLRKCIAAHCRSERKSRPGDDR